MIIKPKLLRDLLKNLLFIGEDSVYCVFKEINRLDHKKKYIVFIKHFYKEYGSKPRSISSLFLDLFLPHFSTKSSLLIP